MDTARKGMLAEEWREREVKRRKVEENRVVVFVGIRGIWVLLEWYSRG